MMRRGGAWTVYGASIAAHVGLAFAVERVEAQPPPPPPPVVITVKEVPPEPPPPPEPPKPPDVPPTPEAAPEVPELEAPPPPPPPTPKPRAPKAANAAAPASSGAPLPTFGMSGGSTGTAVPAGDPSGTPRGDDDDKPREPKRSTPQKKVLDAPKAKPADACEEEETKPRPLSMPQPEYTAEARAAGLAGKVRVQVSIDATGKIEKVVVIGSLDPGLDRAAIAAIERASFEPATRCGKPVSATFKISVKFTL